MSVAPPTRPGASTTFLVLHFCLSKPFKPEGISAVARAAQWRRALQPHGQFESRLYDIVVSRMLQLLWYLPCIAGVFWVRV